MKKAEIHVSERSVRFFDSERPNVHIIGSTFEGNYTSEKAKLEKLGWVVYIYA